MSEYGKPDETGGSPCFKISLLQCRVADWNLHAACEEAGSSLRMRVSQFRRLNRSRRGYADRSPRKEKKLEIIDRAYTRQSNVGNRIVATDVDSLTLWVATAPDRPHRFRFVRDYGWCWLLEHTPYLTVYCFSSGGYHFAGNGGLWLRGKGTLLVVKDGVIYNFGRPDKKADEKFRRQMDSLVADDAELTDYIRKAKGRRDKILRRLSMYKPYNTKQL